MKRVLKRLAVIRVELDREVGEVVVENRRRNGSAPACRRGCHECCHQLTLITSAEALDLVTRVQRHKGDQSLERLRQDCIAQLRQAGGAVEDKRAWFALGLRCVFLDEANACSVYDARPLVCRAHLVISDPVHCSHKRPGDTILYLNTDRLMIEAAQELARSGATWTAPLPYALLLVRGGHHL